MSESGINFTSNINIRCYPVFVAHSHHSFGVRYFPKGIFPRTTSQVTIFQICNFPSGNFLKVRLGLLRRRRLQWGRSAAARMG